MNYFVKCLMMAVFGIGLLVPAESKATVSGKAQAAAWISSGVIAAVCSYIALTQKEQKKYEGDSSLQKAINWFRRVICGTVSKKVQKVEKDESNEAIIKDTYTKATGLFGNILSFYDANEKEIKRAVGIGFLVALGSLNTNIREIAANLIKGVPGADIVNVPKAA